MVADTQVEEIATKGRWESPAREILGAMLAEGTELGGYRIERVLGRGGMSTVYEATQLSLDRTVALKVLGAELGGDPVFRTRFRREALNQAALEHDHIVAVYEAGEDGELLYIAMRLIRGPNLKELIRGSEVDDARTLRLLTPVADALDTAHETGLIHRDVKPQNILVGPRDHAYLADFGLTKAAEHTALTATGKVMGTLDYMPPEQIKGETATPASDVYAFAAVVYECLTGSVPFARPSEAALLFAHISDPPPRVSELRPELPAALDQSVGRGMAKDPAERQPTASELVREVEAGLAAAKRTEAPTRDAGTLPAKPAGPTRSTEAMPPAGPSARSRRRLLIPLAVLLVAAAAGVILLAGGDGSDGAPAALLGSTSLDDGEAMRTTCFGGGDADPCTLAARQLPEGELAAPFDGVVTRWRVRSGEGDLTLRVLRNQGDRPVLVRSSEAVTASDPGVSTFDTCVPIARGDLIGISVARGGGFGVVARDQAASFYRWDSAEPTRQAELDTTEALELLVNADLERPGACELGQG